MSRFRVLFLTYFNYIWVKLVNNELSAICLCSSGHGSRPWDCMASRECISVSARCLSATVPAPSPSSSPSPSSRPLDSFLVRIRPASWFYACTSEQNVLLHSVISHLTWASCLVLPSIGPIAEEMHERCNGKLPVLPYIGWLNDWLIDWLIYFDVTYNIVL